MKIIKGRLLLKLLMMLITMQVAAFFLCTHAAAGELRTVSADGSFSLVAKNSADMSGAFSKAASGVKVRYESSDKKVATVNGKGIVKAKAPGSCIIKRTVLSGGNASESFTVNVIKPLPRDAQPQIRLSFGRMHNMKDFIEDDAFSASFSVDKKGKKVISLSENGCFYPLSEGVAKITAKYGRYKLKFRFSVKGVEPVSEENIFKYGVFLGAEPADLPAMRCYQTIVLDAQYYDSDMIKELKDAGHTVYSYINVGSIEDFRPYYKDYVKFTLGAYENWDEERWVDVSAKEWQDFMLNTLAPAILEKGVDGFFVDNTDVYYNYEREDIFEGLNVILTGLKNTGAYVLINGGDTYVMEYAKRNNTLDGMMDGVNQETIFSSINWNRGTFGKNPASERNYFKEYVEAVKSLGKDVFLLEYTTDTDVIAQIRDYCEANGFTWYTSSTLELLAPGNPAGSQLY